MWYQVSLESLQRCFPDREQRILVCFDHLVTRIATDCEWGDYRHCARMVAEMLIADLGIKPLEEPEITFTETFPQDSMFRSKVKP